jgi:YD repeat-containing protein
LARAVSQTAYARFDAGQARKVAAEVFPALVGEPAGGPPKLPSGETIVDYPADNVAQVAVGGQKTGVIESLAPIALETSPGHHSPIDLHLREGPGGFQEVFPAVDVRIPRQLSDGVALGRTGVSLVPVDGHGAALGGSEGAVEGVTVMYANTLASSDTVIKPTTTGFSAETLLRSGESPHQLYFRVEMPSGARLLQASDGSGAEVVKDGVTLASIPAPVAHDAEGVSVPLEWAVSGSTLTVAVIASFENYRLPIVVDPTIGDSQWQNELYYGTFYRTNWQFIHGPYPQGQYFTAPEHPEGGSWTETISEKHNAEEWGGLWYATHGASQISLAHVEGHWDDRNAKVQNYVVMYSPKAPYTADYDALPEYTESFGFGGYACDPARKCPETTAGPAPMENGNEVAYEQESTGTGATKNSQNTVTQAYVEISQEQSPTIEFEKSKPLIHNPETGEEVPNVLYGSGEWLGPHHGAFEVRAKDPGLGLKFYRVGGIGWGEEKPFYALGECVGVQCPEYVNQAYNYKGLKDGEVNVEAFTEDSAGLYAVIYPQIIKVDATAPHGIKLTGFVNGSELPLGETHLKIEATDGAGTIKSSGLKSITATVDGRAVPGSAASCSVGPCSATSEVTLTARNYSSGEHSLIVTATDNAYNVVQEEFVFLVHGASPIPVGPGSVEPRTGELTLSASDVSLGTAGVSRTYQSRHLTAGEEGPLGPQWAVNLGGGETLTVEPNGNAVLASGHGARTSFLRKANGEYESPTGDGNLKLEAKGSEYILSDATGGTTTKFEQPSGMSNVAPSFEEAFGSEAKLSNPASAAVDPEGNLWVASYANSLVLKFSASGSLLATYGASGIKGGQYWGPWGVAVNPSNGNVYVSDLNNNRIEELTSSGAFIRTFGWGVKDGKAELETCETTECKAGLAGAGSGQLYAPRGVVTDASGNVWAADGGNNRLVEFTATGGFIRQVGSSGIENGHYSTPSGLTISGGNLYVADALNNRIQKLNSTGGWVATYGSVGSEPGKYKVPVNIATETATGNLYVADRDNNRIQEITPAGVFLNAFGTKGSGEGQFSSEGPRGVAVSARGVIYATDPTANRIEDWARPTWIPHEAGGPLAGSTTTYAYTTVEEGGKPIIRPSEALAPLPTGVSSCTPLVRGCRALTFNYAATTTATGENESQWGDYQGHLTRVYLHAWDPSKGAMTEPEVAHYLYDNKGKLRAEWDPRIETSAACGKTCTALPTTYGYDAEGHVTAIRPPGQQPWALRYGTIPGDPETGRLLKVIDPPAATPLHKAELPANTEAPKLTGTPVTGVTLGVSNGKWSGEPIAYSYQWEDCNSEGKACSLILGATNANYKMAAGDVGHRIVATVTATNGGGSVTVASAASVEATPVEIIEYPMTASSAPYAIAAGSDGNLWVATVGNGKVAKVSIAGAVLSEYSLGAGSSPEGITAGPESTLWIAEIGSSKIAKVTTTGTVTQYALPAGSLPTKITKGPDGNLWFTDSGTSKIGKITTAGAITEYPLPAGSTPRDIAAGSDGKLWFTESGTSKIGKITTAGAITEYAAPAGSELRAITAGPDGNLWFTEAKSTASKVAKITTAGVITEYALPSGSAPNVITTGPEGNLWVSNTATNKLAKVTTAGVITEYGLPAGSEPYGLATGPDSKLWFADYGTSKVGRENPSPVEGEHYSPGPGTTLEYGVPVNGAGAPYPLAAKNVEEWGETDDPVEGTAVIAPDEPMGWPATNYKRATISYFDAQARIVNSATPSGAIATSEYNTTNDVVRTLSPDNRAAALKEGPSKSAATAKLLDTQSHYNGETEAERNHELEEVTQKHRAAAEPGTELLETSGPQHKVKLADTGAEVLARNHVKYFYDENSPGSNHYGLVTKTTDGAEYEGKEADMRTSVNSYGGQSNIGWGLRKPTSVTTDPGGLNLTSQTVYDESGNVTETISPGAAAAHPQPTFSFAFGSKGSGEGQFEAPWGIAVSPKTGNLYVTAFTNGKVEEFTPAGKFIAWIGSPGSGEGQMSKPEAITVDTAGNIWVGDSGNDRIDEFNEKGEPVRHFGSKGTATGQFASYIAGITVGPSNVWVSDTGNNRVEQFSLTGTYESSFGKEGSANGSFYGPTGIVLSGGKLYVADYGNHRIQQFTTAGEYQLKWGTFGRGNGQIESPIGLAADPKTGDIYMADIQSDRVEQFTSTGGFVAWLGSYGAGAGQLYNPEDVATNAAGTMYVIDSGNTRAQAWAPGYASARKTQTIYYTTAANATYPECGGRAEWAGLQCRTQPAGQPEDTPPSLPVSIYQYNTWDEVTTTEEKFGSTPRTKAETYDPAGRALTSSTTSSIDTAVSAVVNEYSETTGALVKQSETEGAKRAIASKYNTMGQLTEYTDAEGNVAKYSYEESGDYRLVEVNEGKGEEASSKQSYVYDPTTGRRTTLVDSGVGTFTAEYDVEGNMIVEGYPNGMQAKTGYNPAGETIGLEYVKTTHCTEHCTWFTDALTPSAHGAALVRASTLGTERYTYSSAAQLVQTDEELVGKPCRTRIYGYDEEANRTSLTSREGTEGKCATEGGTTEHHAYESANRLIDSGVSYETFGNTTKLPAADAGEHELVSTYYVDNQLASETQNEETLTYAYDPTGRTLTTHRGKPNTTEVAHYAGQGEAPTWTSEGLGVWTRNVPGLDGTLSATKTSMGTVTLLLHDLEGNIVATASPSETETKLLSTYNSTEFGVPQPGAAPPKYAWLGASGLSTEAALGQAGIANPGGASYVPLIGRPLQTQQIASPGTFPNGAAIASVVQASFTEAAAGSIKALAVEHEAALQAAARQQAEEEAAQNQCPASECGPWPDGGNLPTPPEGGAEEGAECQAAEGCFSLEFNGGGSGAHIASIGEAKQAVEVYACNVMKAANRHSKENLYYHDQETYAHCQYLYRHYGTDVGAILGRGGSVTIRVPTLQDLACVAVGAGVAILSDGLSVAAKLATGGVAGLACGIVKQG